MKKVIIPGIIKDNEKNKFTEGELSFDAPDDINVNGFGRYISLEVATELMEGFSNDFKKKEPVCAVTFGKEALLSLLSQKNCEGIRFYFGKRSGKQWDKSSKYAKVEGLTLVAIGVDEKNNDLGIKEGSILKLPKIKSLSNLKTEKGSTPKIVEVVPPTIWP